MKTEYSSDDTAIQTLFEVGKEEGVVGLTFVNRRGAHIKVLLSRETLPKFIEKLQKAYQEILD